MSSAGHVMDAINRQRYNESLKKVRRKRYQRVKDAYNREMVRHQELFPEKHHLSSDARADLKMKIRKSIIRERRQAFLKSIVTLAIVLLLLVYAFYRLLSNDSLVR